jgi:hypothetical protein
MKIKLPRGRVLEGRCSPASIRSARRLDTMMTRAQRPSRYAQGR